MPKQIKNIFSDTACPSQETMFMYVDNLLKGEEKHAFERHLAGCGLCADAFDGLSMMSKSEAREDIAALHSQIEHQYAAAEVTRSWSWAVAASVSMLLIAGTWAYLHNDRMNSVAVETQTKTGISENNVVEPLKQPELTPSVNIGEIAMDSTVIAPADKTLALSEQEVSQKNISSDAGVTVSPRVQGYDLPKNEPSPVQFQGPQEGDVKVSTSATSGGVYNNNLAKKDAGREKSDIDDQSKGYIESENNSPGSATISSGMLAFEESVINVPSDDRKEVVSPASVTKPAPVTNKASNAPSSPYLKEEEKKKAKTKTMAGCSNCPDKQSRQDAAQDMQELTYDYAVRKFNEKSYTDAHLKFEQYIRENPESEQAAKAGIYDAICLVYLNKPEEALKRLNESAKIKDLVDDTKWLRAAIYIDQDKISEAVSLLKELEKSKVYKEKASKALQDLR